MDLRLILYLLYLGASATLTVAVGRTLHRNGRRFLVDVISDHSLADSINHLLLVGFYLVNLGVAALLIDGYGAPQNVADVVRILATQLGVVALILGLMHFTNLFILYQVRRSVQNRAYAEWYYRQAQAPQATAQS